MNDSDIGELLKAAKDVQLLNAGINTGIVVSTYPTKEHRDLLRAGKPGITPLNTSLGFRNARVPTDPKDPNYSQRHLIQTYRNNALTMTFKGHRNARVAKIEWQEFYLHLLPLVIEHPKLLMTGGKDKVTQTINKLFKPSADFIGDASLNMELQNTMKVKSLCLPILAENPFAKGDKEKELIIAIALEDQGISDVPEESDADDLRKHENVKVQYERALAYIRELTNHTFLRAIYLTSSHQISANRIQGSPTDLLARARSRQTGRRVRTHKVHSPEHHRSHRKGMSLRKRQVARFNPEHLQRTHQAQRANTPQMVAIHAPYSIEVQESPRQGP